MCNIDDNIDYVNGKLKCGVCNKWFTPITKKQFTNLISKAKNYHRLFLCSNECKRLSQGSQKITCAYCGKEFILKKSAIKEKNYCSKECWNNSCKENKKSYICLNCGTECTKKKGYIGKFCCSQCSIEYKNKQIDKLVESGENTSHRILRSYFLRHYNKCMNPDCKWNWDVNDNNPQLELHHIDGNHLNNVISNGILLCPNCHSLTDNYKFKNSHKSSRDRRKYYK